MLQGVDKWLLRTSYHGGYTYIGSLIGNQFYPEMEQYTCSFAALYALQADLSPLSSASHSILKRVRALAWVQRAGLTRRYTCYSMFTEKPSGLAADTVHFSENKDFETGAIGMEYKLRGEFAEMLYHLYMVTEDPIYV